MQHVQYVPMNLCDIFSDSMKTKIKSPNITSQDILRPIKVIESFIKQRLFKKSYQDVFKYILHIIYMHICQSCGTRHTFVLLSELIRELYDFQRCNLYLRESRNTNNFNNLVFFSIKYN